MPIAQRRRPTPWLALTSPGVLSDLTDAWTVAAGATAATWWLLDVPASYLLSAVVLQGLSSGLVLRAFPRDSELAGRRPRGVGAANRVTLGRAALAVPIAALAVSAAPRGPEARWWIVALAALVMILDWLDGHLARRTGSQSRFGARFDMEVDAALILALSILVWRMEILGAWALLIGLMRYLFVAAGLVWPSLRADLPASLRRKAVCVLQGAVLLVALGPPVPRSTAAMFAAAGLLALCYSFAVDVRWALTHARPR